MSKPAPPAGPLAIHLDAVGGVAGDMFIAAVLDAFPALHDGLTASIRAAGLPADIELKLEAHRDHALTGLDFAIAEPQHAAATDHQHKTFGDIRRQLQQSDLAEEVCAEAIAMFTLLARAEASVHGMSIDEVSFHELGEWDSIADIVGAAFIIRELNATWTVGPLPLGSGRVATAHGLLPVPAPTSTIWASTDPDWRLPKPGRFATPMWRRALANKRCAALRKGWAWVRSPTCLPPPVCPAA